MGLPPHEMRLMSSVLTTLAWVILVIGIVAACFVVWLVIRRVKRRMNGFKSVKTSKVGRR
jgi:sensor histidine kinase regulating citrate/malate metabolism